LYGQNDSRVIVVAASLHIQTKGQSKECSSYVRSSSYDIYNEQNTDMELKYIKTNQRESFIGFSYVIGYSIGFGFNTKKVNKQ
jgi:hypothetical protein